LDGGPQIIDPRVQVGASKNIKKLTAAAMDLRTHLQWLLMGNVTGVGIEMIPCRVEEKNLTTAKTSSRLKALDIVATGRCECEKTFEIDRVFVPFDVVHTARNKYTTFEVDGMDDHLLENWLIIPTQQREP
jgi:hypothetical protein